MKWIELDPWLTHPPRTFDLEEHRSTPNTPRRHDPDDLTECKANIEPYSAHVKH